MFDRQVIDDAWGCERTVHPPVKSQKNPALPGEPQLAKVHFGSSFLYDEEARKFRWWACSWDMARPEEDLEIFHAYYESEDLERWTAPTLGMVEYGGSKANNLIHAARRVEYHSASVVNAPPGLQSREKYIMFYSCALLYLLHGRETAEPSSQRVSFAPMARSVPSGAAD